MALTFNPITGTFDVTSSGGSSISPATAVVTETTPSQSPAVGVSTKYAREDHTHGTPVAGGNFPTVKNSTTVAETLTIAAEFQFLCWNNFVNLGGITNSGNMVIL